MALIEGWLPPSRENWELIVRCWQFFPVVASVQWLTDWLPMGKTSITSRLNLPGKWAWLVMETPGLLTVLYLMFTLPSQLGLPAPLPAANWALAGAYVLHYSYRAVLAPLMLNPSMSPIHALPFFSAFAWQVVNGLSLGGWLAGHGPTTQRDWAAQAPWLLPGLAVWAVGLFGSAWHDDELREIRRRAKSDKKGGKVDKVYVVPQNALFRFVLYPHYFCEWIEWLGFWMAAGWGCVPARTFLVNEISTMLPRALAGRRWYVRTFGEDRVGPRKAIIPGLL